MTVSFELESNYNINIHQVAGLDEVGRGCIAGPVVAFGLIITNPEHLAVAMIKDSKQLSVKKREYIYSLANEFSEFEIISVPVETIDKINILQASLLAMEKALLKLQKRTHISHALVDGNMSLKHANIPNYPIIKGDSKSVAIAGASIVAKVWRDNLMHKLHNEYPDYGWDSNCGYPTALHKKSLLQHGITKYHRRSFAPVAKMI